MGVTKTSTVSVAMQGGTASAKASVIVVGFINEQDIREEKFVQPILPADGNLGGDAFAVSCTKSNAWKAFDNLNTIRIEGVGTAVGVIMYNPTPLRLLLLTVDLASQHILQITQIL